MFVHIVRPAGVFLPLNFLVMTQVCFQVVEKLSIGDLIFKFKNELHSWLWSVPPEGREPEPFWKPVSDCWGRKQGCAQHFKVLAEVMRAHPSPVTLLSWEGHRQSEWGGHRLCRLELWSRGELQFPREIEGPLSQWIYELDLVGDSLRVLRGYFSCIF